MKTTLVSHSLVAACLLWCCQANAQTVPVLINYQGQISNPDGTPVATADYELSFSIYDAAQAGARIWGPQVFNGQSGQGYGVRIPIVQGYFNAVLGPWDTSGRSLASAFDGSDRYVEITVAGRSPIAPRQQLLSAPFALKAASVIPNAITTDKLADGAVSEPKLVTGAVSTRTLAGGAVAEPNLANGAVSTRTLQSAAVTAAVIADGAVQTSKLADGSVGVTKMADGIVTTPKLVDGSVTSTKIAAAAVQSANLADGSVQDRHIGVLSRLTASDGSPSQALVVDASGRVGIGTASPSATLDVAGALKVAAMSQQSLGVNGYIQIGELIIQWGQESTYRDIANSDTTTFTFPTPFPREVFTVVPGITSAIEIHATTLAIRSYSLSSVTLGWNEWVGHAQQVKASYIAIGR